MKNKIKLMLTIFVAFLVATSFVNAEQVSTEAVAEKSDSLMDVRVEHKQEVKTNREEVKNTIQNKQEDFKNIIGQKKEDIKNKIQENLKNITDQKKEEMKNLIQDRKDGFQNLINQKKGEVKTRLETAKAEFKASLIKIKDERKQKTVESIAIKIQDLNTKAVENLSDSINKLENVLFRIEARSEEYKTKGIDVSVTTDAIAKAKTAIEVAKQALVEQSGKVYTTKITTESLIKETMTTMKDGFLKDIQNLHEKVLVAHSATKNASVTLDHTSKVTTGGTLDKDNQQEEKTVEVESSTKVETD